MVEFLYPYSFLLLIFLVLFFKKTQKIDINPKIIANKTTLKYNKYFLMLAYIFMVIALARPVSDKKEINTNNELKKVVLSLDISKSMLATDVYPNRLEFAKHKMEQFIDKFNGEIAIMAFSNTAFLVSPYTTNKETLKYLLNNINTSYVTNSGTDFQNLINTAKKLGYKDLVIFSDGGDVKKLDTKGINLYILLIGEKPSPIKLSNSKFLTQNGKIVLVGINKDILKFAKFGEVATTSNKDIQMLISQNFEKTKQNKKIVVYKELFIYPLSVSVLFLFLGFFSLPTRGLGILLLFTIQAKAGLLDWYYLDKAKEAYLNQDYQKCSQLYSKFNNDQAKFNQADCLYKMKEYKKALDIYKEIKDKNLLEKSLYNQGNCYVKLNQIDKAIKSYKDALKLNPNDKEAKYNLELLLKQKNRKKQNKNSNQNKNSKQNNKKNNQKKKQNNKQNSKQTKSKTQQKEINKTKNFKQNQPKKLKPIEIKPHQNRVDDVFNKIKSQTLMVPLSKGETKNEW